MLVLMLEWYVGAHHDFQIPAGKYGKYFKKYLSAPVYEQFRATYSDADYGHMWRAAFEMLSLFGDTAKTVAAELRFAYDESEEKGIADYMKLVQDGLLKSLTRPCRLQHF